MIKLAECQDTEGTQMTTQTSGAADLLAMVSKALREAYNLGQRYWQQADSEYISQHKKADDTRAKFLALVEETCAALAAGQAVAPAEPDPTPGDHPPPCDSELFDSGVSVGLFDIPKWTAEALCKGIAAATGARVDWHYIGGRVHVKALPASTATDGGEADRHALAQTFQSLSDRAFCSYIEQIGRDECLEWEHKVKTGKFGRAELTAHTKASEQLGRHKALQEAANALTVSNAALVPSQLPEPHFGEGRYLGLAFRSDAYSVAQVQALFASHEQSPSPQAAQQPDQSSAAADTVVLEAALRAIHQALDLIGEPDTERLRTVRRVLRGAVVVAEDCKAPQADSQPAPVVDRARIREIFIAHGFTVKEGQTDLKQYVYDAADALLRAARAPADSDLITIRKPTTQAEAVWLAKLAHLLVSDVNYTLGAMLEPKADSVQEDAARLDWLEQNLFHREKDEWDTKFGGYADYNMWVLFSPKGIQGRARDIIDAARKQGANHD